MLGLTVPLVSVRLGGACHVPTRTSTDWSPTWTAVAQIAKRAVLPVLQRQHNSAVSEVTAAVGCATSHAIQTTAAPALAQPRAVDLAMSMCVPLTLCGLLHPRESGPQ